MKTAVVLRHAERQDRSIPQSHLSQAGIEQARVMSARFDRFDFVVASTSPRAFETAIAMGFAVDMTHPSIEQHSEQIMRDVAEIGRVLSLGRGIQIEEFRDRLHGPCDIAAQDLAREGARGWLAACRHSRRYCRGDGNWSAPGFRSHRTGRMGRLRRGIHGRPVG